MSSTKANRGITDLLSSSFIKAESDEDGFREDGRFVCRFSLCMSDDSDEEISDMSGRILRVKYCKSDEMYVNVLGGESFPRNSEQNADASNE